MLPLRIGGVHQVGIEEVEFLFSFVGRTAVLMSHIDPLPLDSTIEALDRLIKGDQIVTAFLAYAEELSRVRSLGEGGNCHEEEGKCSKEGNPVFHGSWVMGGSIRQIGPEILKSDYSGNDGNHIR